ncbi:MAG TPA: hypothetical protein VGH13_08420 [Xanthobacteraceae bacterium]
MPKGLLRLSIVLSALAAMMPLAAQAADPAACRDYATAAIRQVRGAVNNARCLPGLQGARWSADFKVHYNWCLTANYAAMGTERDARTAYLRSCTGQ